MRNVINPRKDRKLLLNRPSQKERAFLVKFHSRSQRSISRRRDAFRFALYGLCATKCVSAVPVLRRIIACSHCRLNWFTRIVLFSFHETEKSRVATEILEES
jgi:hypothetical protein